MHQISLLGGLGTDQHGDSSHIMRPDRVYRTSVLSPMVGYRPGYDVQRVAQEFTLGPQSGMSLGGLRGTFGDRLRMWWHGAKARASGSMPNYHAAAAAQAQAQAHAQSMPITASEPVLHPPGASQPPSRTGWGGDVNAGGYSMAPAIMTAHHVGPFARGIPGQMVEMAYSRSPSLPAFASDAAAKTTMMQWRGVRWPWG